MPLHPVPFPSPDILSKGNYHMWIGMRAVNDTGAFEWVDGSPVQYTNWYPGQPDNLGGNEPCAEVKDSVGAVCAKVTGPV